MTDLALNTQGDLILNEATGEIELLQSAKDVISQRKHIELSSAPASLVEAPYEGALIPKETTLNKTSLSRSLNFFEKVFGNDDEIDPESVEITPTIKNGSRKFHISFRTFEEGEASSLVA